MSARSEHTEGVSAGKVIRALARDGIKLNVTALLTVDRCLILSLRLCGLWVWS